MPPVLRNVSTRCLSHTSTGQQISNNIDNGHYSQVACEHPLFFFLTEYTFKAMERVGDIKLYNDISLVSTLPSMNGNTGSIIGTLFEYNLAQVINEDFSEYKPQRKRSDCDIICEDNSLLDFEVKTTSATTEIYGNRIQPSSKNGSFLLAVNYDKRSLEIKKVRFGWIDQHCWISQNGNGQQSRLNKEAHNVRLQVC